MKSLPDEPGWWWRWNEVLQQWEACEVYFRDGSWRKKTTGYALSSGKYHKALTPDDLVLPPDVNPRGLSTAVAILRKVHEHYAAARDELGDALYDPTNIGSYLEMAVRSIELDSAI
jgi:hypothetical protein